MKTILVIEDNADNLDLVLQILENANFKLLTAATAEDGIEMIKQGSIDLVLMDLSLPNMDGLEATRLIRANNNITKMPIIALTAHAMNTDREDALEAGCNDYLSKPIDDELLIETVKNYLK